MEMLSSSDNTDHIAAITLMSLAADIIYKLAVSSSCQSSMVFKDNSQQLFTVIVTTERLLIGSLILRLTENALEWSFARQMREIFQT